MLLFKKVFWDAVRRGEKRTTLRRWRHPRVRAGSRAFAPGVGWLWIESVDIVRLCDLTPQDARDDGFASRSKLRTAMRAMYRNQGAAARQRGEMRWYRIRFRVE